MFKESIKIIQRFEGFSDQIYYCPAGYRTIGFGHKLLKNESFDIISKEQALKLLLNDINNISKSLSRLIKVELNNNQLNALISFCFNLGCGTFQISTLRKKVNSYEFDNASTEFLRWVWVTRPKIMKLKGLVNRREVESNLFQS